MPNIFVENLAVNTTEQAVRAAFEAFGQVSSVKIVADRDTGIPRGLAFVEMGSDVEAHAAVAGLNGKMIDGRVVNVNEAQSKKVETNPIESKMRRHRRHRY